MKAGMILQVLYDSQGRVSSEILPDGATYSFRYVADERETITEVDVIGVRSQVTRVLVHGDNYTVEQAP
jgi:YD repeat-containing protein